ncbi:MAG: hypothetical protein AAF702_44510 [Chloroflexota bacterium]
MIYVYCDNCEKAQPAIFEPLTSDDLNPKPWGDIVCSVCHLVLATLSADQPGEIVLVPAPPMVTELKMTCNAAPVQWRGRTQDGQHVYIRGRWGQLSVGLGETFDDAVGNSQVIGSCDDTAGIIDSELVALTEGVLRFDKDVLRINEA